MPAILYCKGLFYLMQYYVKLYHVSFFSVIKCHASVITLCFTMFCFLLVHSQFEVRLCDIFTFIPTRHFITQSSQINSMTSIYQSKADRPNCINNRGLLGGAF